MNLRSAVSLGCASVAVHEWPLVDDIVAKVGEGRLGRNNRIGMSKFLN
jgi:hypothetical protein